MIDPPLWVLPPLQPGATRFVVFSWLAMGVSCALFWAGVVWAIVAWCAL